MANFEHKIIQLLVHYSCNKYWQPLQLHLPHRPLDLSPSSETMLISDVNTHRFIPKLLSPYECLISHRTYSFRAFVAHIFPLMFWSLCFNLVLSPPFSRASWAVTQGLLYIDILLKCILHLSEITSSLSKLRNNHSLLSQKFE